MDRFTRMLAGLLGRSAGLLPAGRRDWAEAVLAEAGEIRSGAGRVMWLGGGLWLVTREVLMRAVRWLAFAAGAAGVAWAGWPGSSSNSATPLNRIYVVVTVVALAVLPAVVRRYFGPVRPGWGPRAARAGGYALVLALIAGKMVKDRLGSRLGFYFAISPGQWFAQIVLLLLIVGYVGGLLALTSRRGAALARWTLPAVTGIGAAAGAVLYGLEPFGRYGQGPGSVSANWWWLTALLPLATGCLAVRLAARSGRPAGLSPVQQAAVAGGCATVTAGLVLAALTSVTVALLPHHVPVQTSAGDNGVCQTCDPARTVIPAGLRHEYQAEITVGQAGTVAMFSLLIAPFFGAWLGVVGGGIARRAPRRRVAGGAGARAPRPAGGVMASDADRDLVIGTLTAAFAQGRLTKDELDLRAGRALAARTGAELAALTADLPDGPADGLTGVPSPGQPGRARTRPPRSRAVAWCSWGLLTPVLFAAGNAFIPGPTPANNEPAGKILALLVGVYFLAWLVIGVAMLATWYQERPRMGGSLPLLEPGPPAAGE